MRSTLDDLGGQPDIHALVPVEMNDRPAPHIEGESVTVAGFLRGESWDCREPSFYPSPNRYRVSSVRPIRKVV